ncbi:MAG: glycosyltransferase family 4 protein [Terriglobales bacterium]
MKKREQAAAHRSRILFAGSIDDDNPRLLKLYHAYASAGYDVHFVGMDRLSNKPRTCQVDGLTCEYLTRGWGYSNWKLLIGYPIWCAKLLLYCLRADCDLFHSFELDSGGPAAIAGYLRKIPHIYDVQDNYDLRHDWPFPLKPLIRWFDSWVIRHAAGVIVPDENRLVGPFTAAAEKAAIMPNCPPDVPPPSAPAERKAKMTVLAMGHLSRGRGVHLLLDAVNGLPDVRLLMAGRFSEPDLEARAKAMGQVEFRGWIDWQEAIALGYQADVVFAFYDPSSKVNLLANAQKWFDAMMTATPILSNREIGNAAWIEEGDFGYLCPFGDVPALRTLLQHIVAHPEEAKAKGRRGRALFEQKYNWALMEKKLLHLAGVRAGVQPDQARQTGECVPAARGGSL